MELSAVGRQGGSTASVFLIHRSGLAVAGNVGDSSILLIEHSEEPVFSASVSPACETGISRVYAAEPAVPEEGVDTAWTAEWRSYMLSRDHIPTDKTEAHRVQGAGGKLLNGRVMGSVNITRALGDHVFKYPFNAEIFPEEDPSQDFLSAFPHTTELQLHPDKHPIVVLASDGLWNSVKPSLVTYLVASASREGLGAAEICSQLINAAAGNRKASGGDNVSVVVGRFLWESGHKSPTKEETSSPSPSGSE